MSSPDSAATVLVLRESEDPFEVLMVERNDRGFFGSIEVFPGGRVDEIDMFAGRLDEGSHRRAALRELAEESSIVITTAGALPYAGAKGPAFYEWLETSGHELDLDSLILVSRWVTPEGAPRRFDTLFYLIAPGALPSVRVDTEELVGHRWTTAAQAIARHERGESAMIMPTVAHLRWLAKRSSVGDAIASARGADGKTAIEPRRIEGNWVPVHRHAEMS